MPSPSSDAFEFYGQLIANSQQNSSDGSNHKSRSVNNQKPQSVQMDNGNLIEAEPSADFFYVLTVDAEEDPIQTGSHEKPVLHNQAIEAITNEIEKSLSDRVRQEKSSSSNATSLRSDFNPSKNEPSQPLNKSANQFAIERIYSIPSSASQSFKIPESRKVQLATTREISFITAKYVEVEAKLVDWMKWNAKMGAPRTRAEFSRAAGELAAINNGSPSAKWIDSFMNRHPDLSFQQSPVNASLLNVSIFKKNLLEILARNNFEHMLHEPSAFGILNEETEGNCMVKRTEEFACQGHLQHLFCYLADGRVMEPLLILNEPKLRPQEQYQFHPLSSRGYFFSFLTNHFVKQLDNWNIIRSEHHPFYLFVDVGIDTESFQLYEWCRKNFIVIMKLPYQARLSLKYVNMHSFGSENSIYKSEVAEWKRQNSDRGLTLVDHLKIVKLVIDKVLPKAEIKNIFRNSGIYPLKDPVVQLIDEDAGVSSSYLEVTEEMMKESDQAIISCLDQSVKPNDNSTAQDKGIIDKQLDELKKILGKLKPLLESKHPNCLPYLHMCEFNLEQLYKQVADSPTTVVQSIEQPSETLKDRPTEIIPQESDEADVPAAKKRKLETTEEELQVGTVQETLKPDDKSEERIVGDQNEKASDLVARDADIIVDASAASDEVFIISDGESAKNSDNDSEPSPSSSTLKRSSDLNDGSAQASLDTKFFEEFREEMRRYYEQIISDINLAGWTQSEKLEKRLPGKRVEMLSRMCDTKSIQNRSADHQDPVQIKISSHEQFTQVEKMLSTTEDNSDFKNRLASTLVYHLRLNQRNSTYTGKNHVVINLLNAYFEKNFLRSMVWEDKNGRDSLNDKDGHFDFFFCTINKAHPRTFITQFEMRRCFRKVLSHLRDRKLTTKKSRRANKKSRKQSKTTSKKRRRRRVESDSDDSSDSSDT